jgi:putative FmdB family regulatory protein
VPTYQYACTACGQQLEAVQSFTDDALTDCPNCAGQLRKVFSAVGIVFKGSGFYRTDSRKGDVAAASSNGAKESNGDGGGSRETKTDSKPASSESTSSSSSTPSTTSSTTSTSSTPAKTASTAV